MNQLIGSTECVQILMKYEVSDTNTCVKSEINKKFKNRFKKNVSMNLVIIIVIKR